LVLRAALPDGLFLDLLSRFQDLRTAAMVDVGGRKVAEALVAAAVVVVLDEGADLPFEVSRQEVVFQQDAVLQGQMPAFDLARPPWASDRWRTWGWCGAPRTCSMPQASR
jgi:hypothetical protein